MKSRGGFLVKFPIPRKKNLNTMFKERISKIPGWGISKLGGQKIPSSQFDINKIDLGFCESLKTFFNRQIEIIFVKIYCLSVCL